MRRRKGTVKPSERKSAGVRAPRRSLVSPHLPFCVSTLALILTAAALCPGPQGRCASVPGQLVNWGMRPGGRRGPTPGKEYMALSAGGYHDLALTAGGTLVAWGENSHGQCNVPTGSGFVAVAAGLYHNLALRADGSIVAWGDNSRGQCDAPRDGRFFAIAAGHWHSLAVRTDGSLVAWGWNDHKQCDVPDGNGYVDVSAGYYHSIALRADQSIVAWGGNGDGQCDVPPGGDFARIAAGTLHNVALRANGSLATWGRSDEGQCDAPPGYHFASVAAGSLHSVALTTDGRIIAWGRNDYTQCDAPADSNFVDVTAAGFHTGAIRDNRSKAERLRARAAITPPEKQVVREVIVKTPPATAAREPDRRLDTNRTTPAYAKPPKPSATKKPSDRVADAGRATTSQAGPEQTDPNRAESAPQEQAKVPVVSPVDANGRPVNPGDPASQGIAPDLYMDVADNAAPVYHFTSATSTRHFCTISEEEKYDLIDNHSDIWTYEGIAFFAYPEGRQPADARPVHRFWSSDVGRHLYTMDEGQKQLLVELFPHVWKYEGVAWYAPPAKPTKE